jgi:hypothetical protein
LVGRSVSIGSLDTAARGGGDTYGRIGSLGPKTTRTFDISADSPVITSSMDKELVRRVIEAHRAQARYCYERALTSNPGLWGKVVLQWTIDADGHATKAHVKETTLGNTEVERCLVDKISTWVFPKPIGGGTVIVNYPFVFKQTG